MGEQSAAVVFGLQRDLAEGDAFDAGDVVVPGEAVVQHGPIGVEEVGDVEVLCEDLGEEAAGLGEHGGLEGIVIFRIELLVGRGGVDVAQGQPLVGEVAHEALRAAIGEESVGLGAQGGGLQQRTGLGHPAEFVIRCGAPEHVAESSGDGPGVEASGLFVKVEVGRRAEHSRVGGQQGFLERGAVLEFGLEEAHIRVGLRRLALLADDLGDEGFDELRPVDARLGARDFIHLLGTAPLVFQALGGFRRGRVR